MPLLLGTSIIRDEIPSSKIIAIFHCHCHFVVLVCILGVLVGIVGVLVAAFIQLDGRICVYKPCSKQSHARSLWKKSGLDHIVNPESDA